MSQIPHSQLALKKRSTPVVDLNNDVNKGALKNQKNSSSIGHKNDNGDKSNGHDNKTDKDVIILDDEYTSIPVGREEIVEEKVLTQSDEAPLKKKRGRRPKHSTDSRESSELATLNKSDEMSESNEPTPKKDADPVPIDENSDEKIDIIEELPTPEPSPKETKILKLSIADLPVSSKRRSDRLQNASTIVNLSTVSSMDQSTKLSSDTNITETPITERKVSGRRSTRPIDDIKFTYRSPDPDESIANATIGSEIGDNLLETPLTDRKKRRIDSLENIDSPKRSRLDLSALFNNFYSPVTMLRSKFRRANLESTPKAGGILDDSINSVDTSASEMKEIDLIEKSEENNVKTDDDIESDGSLKFIVKPAKKSVCSIM